jgi:hypothetical protein
MKGKIAKHESKGRTGRNTVEGNEIRAQRKTEGEN